MYLGWDWASQRHDVTVIDDTGQLVDRWTLAHTEAGIDQAMTRLAGHGRPDDLPVAIQATSGIVVDRLLAAGHPVVPIHPNSFNAARPRWGASKAKSDPGDSFKLAEDLRTDSHRLRRCNPPMPPPVTCRPSRACAPTTWRPRHCHQPAQRPAGGPLARRQGDLARLDSDTALDFLERYPTPQAAQRLGGARLAAFLGRHGYSGRRTPGQLLHRLRAAPVAVDQLDPEVLADCIHIQVRLLRSLLGSLADLDRALAAALGEHPKATVLQPLPRIGQINLAQVLAEVGPILDRASDLSHAAAEVGATPVTKQSAVVQFRWAANTRAGNALGSFADNSRHAAPWAAHRYRQARRRGKRHPQAIRILMRAWLGVIWVCWHTGRPYDSNHHRAEQRLAQEPAA
jgi:hypothetical protein